MDKPQTIFRVIKNEDCPFVMIDKRIVENPALSWSAKGMLAYLLSRPNNWTINIRDLINRATEGEFAVRRITKELIQSGHLKRIIERGENKTFKRFIMEVHEQPINEPFGGNPQMGNPQMGNPQMGNPQMGNLHLNNIESNNIDNNNILDGEEPQPADPIPVSPLIATSPKQQMLFDRLTGEIRAKHPGAREIKKFPSLACKAKFEQAEKRIGDQQMEQAINRACEVGAISVPRAVDFIAKWNTNGSGKPSQPIVAHLTPDQVDAEYNRLNAHLIGKTF